MKKTNPCLETFACFFAVLFLLSTAQAQQAEKILDDTGIKGGLIVHLGCGDGKLTAALRANDSYLVHGLDGSAANVEQARKHIESLGLYGKVSVEYWKGRRLPYTDNLVNLIVAHKPVGVPQDELMRVLAPNGVVYINTGKMWKKKVKPWPAEIDEWTHFLHDASNNAVAQDSVVGPPHHIQWQGKPKFARAHEQIATLSACVTSGGRMFYIIDEAQQADIRFPSRWFLVARDAFNGVVLWKRPVSTWADQFRRFRSGPADLPFRLVAGRDRLYVTLGVDAPVSVLDPATGKTLYVYQGTENTRHIAHVDDRLILLVDTGPQNTAQVDSEIRRGVKPAPGVRKIIAAGASGDNILWSKTIESFIHPTVAAQNGRLFYQTMDSVCCLDIASGDELWRAATEKMELKGHELGWESPTLVVQDKVVYSADFKQMIAFSADSGKQLWTSAASPGYNSPPDVFVMEDLVWAKDKNVTRKAFDTLTGELKKEFPSVKGYMHHRCYRNKATGRFIILGNQGVQFIDVTSGEIWQNYWIRGTCQYGIMPANGMLYVTPDSCACNLTTKLNGFYALAAGRTAGAESPEDVRFEKGPAYGQSSASSNPQGEAWPTYRHDETRSGITQAQVDPALEPWWHRGYWVINDQFLSHWSAWWKVGNQVPSGRILSYNDASVFGFGRDQYVGGNTGQWRGGEKYQLFAYDRSSDAGDTTQAAPQPANKRRGQKAPPAPPLKYRWTGQVPLFVTAMVVADKTMFVAGPPDVVRTEDAKGEQALALENPKEIVDAWAGGKGAILWAVSAEDGSKLAEYELEALPIFDGMAATNGRLYLPMKNGQLLCLTNK